MSDEQKAGIKRRGFLGGVAAAGGAAVAGGAGLLASSQTASAEAASEPSDHVAPGDLDQ